MNRNYVFRDVNEALPTVMSDLLDLGDEFPSRAGRTKELMHVGITLQEPWSREIVLPDRKASVAAQIVETMWVLSGRNDVAGLAPYLPRALDFSDDGLTWRAGYGRRLRSYGGVDQLAYVVDTLREGPGSRQAVATLWDPMVDTTAGKDIACNNWLSFSSRFGELDLHVGVRSNDAMWGWSGINAFEWSVLQEAVARLCGNLWTGSLHFSVTSFHLYEQHWSRARRIANNRATVYAPSPRLGRIDDLGELDLLLKLWFVAEEKIRTGQFVDADSFPDPLMRSWLRVLQWYWSGDEEFLAPLAGTQLWAACMMGVHPAGKPQEPSEPADTFLLHVNALHTEKHAAYGDSWKRRGEPGILSNIARKIDRLDTGVSTRDETQLDTAIDLLVYLAKYRSWLSDGEGSPAEVARVLSFVEAQEPETLEADFKYLEAERNLLQKISVVERMMGQAMGQARKLWRN